MIDYRPGVPPEEMGATALAFLGDAVFELLARSSVLQSGNAPANALHRHTVCYVSAAAQSAAMDKLMPILTEKELAIFKRGRNDNHVHPPKNSNPAEYRRATGLEALFGYLYLTGQMARIEELFSLVRESVEKKEEKEEI